MSWDDLNPEQAERAREIYEELKQGHDDKLKELAALLASKPDSQLLGKTEFEVRDIVHKLGAESIQAAAHQRKKATVFRVKG